MPDIDLQLKATIERLELKPGDFVLLRLPKDVPTQHMESYFRYVREAQEMTGVPWIVLGHTDELTVVSRSYADGGPTETKAAHERIIDLPNVR